MKFDKKNKLIIITGAGQGIGRAIALYLDKKGFIVVLVDKDYEKLKKALKEFNPQALIFSCDVSKEKQVVSTIRKVIKKFKRIDVLINNAGISESNQITNFTKKEIDRIIDTNLKGTIYFIREAVRQMKRQRSGQIINISSAAAKYPEQNPFRGIYCASKIGQAIFGESSFRELRTYNIKVANIFPALTFTPLALEARQWSKKEFNYATSPEDIAKAILTIINQGKNSNILEVVFSNMGP